MKYKGSCHCGQVAFEVDGELKQVMDCNCSICSRKGSLLWLVPRDKLRLLTPEENLSTYTFGKHLIKHRFLPQVRHPSVRGRGGSSRESHSGGQCPLPGGRGYRLPAGPAFRRPLSVKASAQGPVVNRAN